MRTRVSPKSPSKRIFADSNESGGINQALRKRRSTELDDDDIDLLEGEDKENSSRHNEDHIMSWKAAQTKQEKCRSGGLMAEVPPLSPMKRTDGVMNLDHPDFGSPSAKRRSMHAPSVMDFSIFEADNLQDGTQEKRSQDDHDWFRNIPLSPSTRFSTIPKRSHSLRKSTLQQRQSDKSSPLRLNNFAELRQNWPDSTPNSKKPVRISLDNRLPIPQRDSPFSAQGGLLNASIHPITSSQGHSSQEAQFKHPLSNAVTQSSSSTPSVQDDSPTHEPARRIDRSKYNDFSKSLPIGALRPHLPPDAESSQFSSQGSFATPAAYKAAKPLPAAFMSTGLISKRNRNTDELDAGLPKAHMPDTPCKKQSLIFAPPKDVVKPANAAINNLRTSFGTPRSPSEVPFGITRASPFPWAKSTSIFSARAKQSLARKASFASIVSIETDDKPSTQSPAGQGESQSTENEYPPTPTKHMTLIDGRASSISPSPQHVMSKPRPSMSSQAVKFANSKLPPIQASRLKDTGDSDSVVEDSPSAKLQPMSMMNVVSQPHPFCTQRRRSRHFNPPTPFSYKSIASLKQYSLRHAELTCFAVVPHLGELDHSSPKTPCEGIFPPDPSTLSISGKHERPTTRQSNDLFSFLPATPTGPREYFGNFSNRPSLNLNAPEVTDGDQSLSLKFDKVDLVGTGEFSQVYRVAEPPETSPFHKSFTTSRPSSRSSVPGKVWAVKKSRHPYSGPKDRARKVHEVDVLKALGQNDHVVYFVNSWEDRGHLYIQTEFCEEGTLDVFLAQVGSKARLDDFRIWKILLELSLVSCSPACCFETITNIGFQGLKHVHDMGYIHLDLKPANILITFEGVLKIGDFGMTTKWPAKAGIEGEGDREYIGPEILMGRYDKPADVFALGLIMLETAGNVELPDNGASWQKLRNGDMSDVPSLTWSSEDSNIPRDAIGNPMMDDEEEDVEVILSNHDHIVPESQASKATCMVRRGELLQPPSFMTTPTDDQSLDGIVRWMISPNPDDRPVIDRILHTQGVQWAESRRRAGATIFEGNWGPADEILAEDAEMIDV